MASRKNDHLQAHYAPHVEKARERITNDPGLAPLIAPETSSERVLAFLIQFSARGVQMTEPVERWIRTAGQRCLELGWSRLGRSLIEHAKHEAGHHQLMLDDLQLLNRRWVAMGRPSLDEHELLAQPPTLAMRRYFEIHEETIAGDHPYGQIAIELEIERMSTVLGPTLLEACGRALGPDIVKEMSFISEHSELDVGHTAMNEAELDRFLADRPDVGPTLAELGGRALHIYLDFLDECVEAGDRLLTDVQQQTA